MSQISLEVEKQDASSFLKSNFSIYSINVILNRALLDKGLKPVQRRILYVMFKRGLSPQAKRQKVATIGGAVLEYHPHGDSSVNEALKNMGRTSSFRVPLIDGKGSFGTVDSDGAAARYIDARLSRAGWLNVEDLSYSCVDFIDNYDGSSSEPLYLPVKFPISLINGTKGLAIGYASNIPSHNPTEIMNACRLLLKEPEASDTKLLNRVKGPDFNSGGVITSSDGVKEYLLTGSGSFKIRGKYRIKSLPRGRSRIEFYEIPYGVRPDSVFTSVQKDKNEGRAFDGVSRMNNSSDLKNPMLLVFETKAGVQPESVVSELFKRTPLESSFPANLTVILNGRPVQCGIRDILSSFIEFRKDCVVKKTMNILEKKEARLHILEGLLSVLVDIDSAVSIIRKSNDSEEASTKLMKKFSITEGQAAYVLSLQLRRLTKMDSLDIKNEKKSLDSEVIDLREIIENDERLTEELDKEFKETAKIIGDGRITEILDGDEFEEEERLAKEELKAIERNSPCSIYLTQDGSMIKVLSGSPKVPVRSMFSTRTQDDIVAVDSSGMGYRFNSSLLPFNKPVQLSTIVPQASRVVGLSQNDTPASARGLLLCSALGQVKISRTDFPKTLNEFPVFNLADGDELVDAYWLHKTTKGTHVALLSSSGKCIVFETDDINPSGSKAGGVAGMRLKDDEKVVYGTWVQSRTKELLVSLTNATIKVTEVKDIPVTGRGGQGVFVHKFLARDTEIVDGYIHENPCAYVDDIKLNLESSRRGGSGENCELSPVVLGYLEG